MYETLREPFVLGPLEYWCYDGALGEWYKTSASFGGTDSAIDILGNRFMQDPAQARTEDGKVLFEWLPGEGLKRYGPKHAEYTDEVAAVSDSIAYAHYTEYRRLIDKHSYK